MDDYIQHLNSLFINETDFNELYIDKIVDDSYKFKTPMSELIIKYSSSFWGESKIVVDDSDCQIILNNMNEEDHPFIKIFEHFLIANNKSHYNDSCLVDLTKEYVNFYFKNIDFIKDGLPINNLDKIIHWCYIKYPNERRNILNSIYLKIEMGEISNIHYLSTATWFLNKYKNEISEEVVFKIYNKYLFVRKVENTDIYFYYQSYKDFLSYFENNKSKRKELIKDIVDFTLKNVELFDNHHVQIEFQIIRRYMDELKCYSNEQYQVIDSMLERANKDALSKLQSINIPLPKEQEKIINDEIAKISSLLETMTSIEQIDYLMNETTPFSKKAIEKSIDDENKRPLAFINEQFLDSDGRVINFDKLSTEEEFSLKAGHNCYMTIDIYLSVLYSTFVKNFKVDDNFKQHLTKILDNNIMVSEERVDLLNEQFVDFFNNDYKHSVFDIVFELEESLRHFFKSEGLNIYKTDGSGDLIGLNNIFNDNGKNSFRDKILEVMDEDNYFTFKWLLCDKYGFGLRDKIGHRIKSKDLYKTKPAIYAVIHIFRLYWFMQDSKH